MTGMVVAKELEHWRGGKGSPGRRDAVRQTLQMVQSDVTIRPEKVYHVAYLRGELNAVEALISDLRSVGHRDGEVALAVDLRTGVRRIIEMMENTRRDLAARYPSDSPASSSSDIDRLWREDCGLADGQLAVLREYRERLDRWVRGDVSLPTGGANPEDKP